MPISLRCACGAFLEIDDKFAGKTIHCPDCQRPLQPVAPASDRILTSGWALTSLVLALVGAFTLVGTALAILTGFCALRQINRHPDRLVGRGYAISGIALGTVFTGISLLAFAAVDYFGLDRFLREPEWAGKLDYGGGLEAQTDRITLMRPGKAWAVYRGGDNAVSKGPKDTLMLVNVQEDAHAIAFIFLKGQLVDDLAAYRDSALEKFQQSELVRLLNRRRKKEPPVPEVTSVKEIPAEAGQQIQEVVFSMMLGRHERTFLMRIKRGPDEIYVVAAGVRKRRFKALEDQLQQIVAGLKVSPQ
jgi:hypothetical protein